MPEFGQNERAVFYDFLRHILVDMLAIKSVKMGNNNHSTFVLELL